MDDSLLTQNESRLVVEWLKQEHKVKVGHKLSFWKLRPSSVADRVRKDWKIQVSGQEISMAARRDE